MSVTLSDIAKAVGVSVSTVSRALNESDHSVNAKTKARILGLAQEMGYRPNFVARSLQRGSSLRVGVVVDSIGEMFTPKILWGIEDALTEAGYTSTIISSHQNPESEMRAIERLLSLSVDGIILVDTNVHATLGIGPRSRKPLVYVNRRFGDAAVDAVSVISANHAGGYAATKHLIKLGHKRIAHIGGPKDWEGAERRLQGYLDALRDSGLPEDPQLVARAGNWDLETGYSLAQGLLDLELALTAIFAANDLIAIGAIYAAHDRGLRVPEDVAVVGYDNRRCAEIIRPWVTTIEMPSYDMGAAAVQRLLEQLEGTDVPLVTEVPSRLVVRESCGAQLRP